jgi:hypothetical protein
LAKSTTIAARTAALADVITAVNVAASGDTVKVPAGAVTWAGELVISKPIQVLGAGNGTNPGTSTIITNIGKGTVFRLNINTTSPYARVSNFRLVGGTVSQGDRGAVSLNGQAHAFRIDHIIFDRIKQRCLTALGGLWGVIDHCEFNSSLFGETVIIDHNTWNIPGSTGGDSSWADAAYPGTERAIYIEDCIFHSGPTDTNYGGGRYVVRHCTFLRCAPQTHGTETSQRGRSARYIEAYNNILFPGIAGDVAILMRGGSLTYFNNYVTGFTQMIGTRYYRLCDSFPPWGGADGANPWDVNVKGTTTDDTGVATINPVATGSAGQGDIYAQGQYTGPAIAGSAGGQTITLHGLTSPAGAGWKGFSFRNVTGAARGDRNYFGLIYSSKGNVITTFGSTQGITSLPMRTGDYWEIRKVKTGLDQPGNGRGDLISGTSTFTISTVTGRPSWPNQAVDGNYAWSNKSRKTATSAWPASNGLLNVSENGKVAFAPWVYSTVVKANFDGVVRPGYPWNANSSGSPANVVGADTDPNRFTVTGSGGYIYPHPLVSGGTMPTPTATPGTAPSAPTNLTVSPGS